MFWGVVLQGNKTHSHLVEDTYQVSQAALEPNSKSQASSPDLVSVWVKSEEGDEYLLCTLEHGKTWQAPVSLLALEGSEMAYLVKGDGKIHLTGCLVPEDDEFEDFEGMEDEELSDEEDEELDTSNGEVDARNVINGKRAALALPPANSPAKKMKSDAGKAVAGKAVANQPAGQKKEQPKANGAAKAPQVEEDDDDDEDDEEDEDEEMENNLGKLLAGADDDDEDDEDMDDEEDDEDEDEEDEEVEKLGKQQLKNNLSKNTPNQQKGKVQTKQESNITPKQKQNKFAGGEQKKRTPGPGKNQQQGNRSFGGNNSNKKPGFNKQGGGGQKGGSPFGNNQARNKFANKQGGGKWSGKKN